MCCVRGKCLLICVYTKHALCRFDTNAWHGGELRKTSYKSCVGGAAVLHFSLQEPQT